MRKQTRFFMAAAIVVTGVWIVGLRNGAYLHEFWGFLVLVPGVVGMGVLLEKAATLVTVAGSGSRRLRSAPPWRSS